MSRSKVPKVRAGAVSGVSEVRAFTNDMCEAALVAAAELALVGGRVLCWVGDSAILAVPSEVPDVANFPVALGNAPFAQVPEARCESDGVLQHRPDLSYMPQLHSS